MKSSETVVSNVSSKISALRGSVVGYATDDRDYSSPHERATREGIARRIAELKGYEYAGEYEPSQRYGGPVYFVPSDTLVGIENAHGLGIRSENDLFGGVVPYAFVATKAITHPLIEPHAFAPEGWSRDFWHRVHDSVPFGYTVFTPEDVRSVGASLLKRRCPVRIKRVRATAGRGQQVVTTAAELEQALAAMDAGRIANDGLVLEENLDDVTTLSVGQVRVAGIVASYYGSQTLTVDNQGEQVYGGSDLVVVRGDFDALLEMRLPDDVRRAVAHARTYDAAARECFPGFFASRRNYDVVLGRDCDGRERCGVLEQSWRMGGASGAELGALHAFHDEPSLHVVRARTVELYGGREKPPPHATVYFNGIDDRVGPMLKYAVVEPHADTR